MLAKGHTGHQTHVRAVWVWVRIDNPKTASRGSGAYGGVATPK